MKNTKIILWDIETSPIITRTWSLYKPMISYDNVIEDWYILCAAWKELGSKTVKSVEVSNFKDGKYSDRELVKALRDELADADILIGHNMDKFDLKKLNTRLVFHNLDPLPKIVTIDTLKHARREFSFSSNRLDALGSFLGLGRKIKTDYDLWIDVCNGDKVALAKMVKYCKGDVQLLESVYLRLKKYMKNHPNIASKETMNCPRCNSDHSIIHKTRLMASGLRKIQHQCKNCGSYFTEKNTIREQPLSRV